MTDTKPAIVTLDYLPSSPTEASTRVTDNDDGDDDIVHPTFSPKIVQETSHTLPLLQWQCKDLRTILVNL